MDSKEFDEMYQYIKVNDNVIEKLSNIATNNSQSYAIPMGMGNINNQSEKAMSSFFKEKEEHKERDKANSNNLERIANSNDIIVKLLDKDLDFISRMLEQNNGQNIERQTLLLQLTKMIEDRDEKNTLDFIGKITGTVGMELLVSYLKTKLGFTL